MDQFGLLVESIGFKAHGKSSAPLADLKGAKDIQSNPRYNSIGADVIFGSNNNNNNNKPPSSDLDDVFGGSSSNIYNDDVFGLMKRSSVGHYDVLGNKVVTPVMQPNSNSVDDLLGDFSGMGVKPTSGLSKGSVNKHETASEPADLLSDFTVKISSFNGMKSEASPAVRSAKSFSASEDDPFGIFERPQGSGYQVNNGASVVDDYLDSLFTSGVQANTRSSQSSTTEDFVFDALFNNNVVPKQQKSSSVSSNSRKQTSSKANNTGDFSYLFEMGVAPPSGQFQEIEGESEERRKVRFNHHMTTRERMNNALNEKNKRDLQVLHEQEEKRRVAATLEGDIKRWALGKEGNLRALLSSLQHILWAGSGWQPISLTDLITSTAVKKAYYKATLCVHPDKVQQKGAGVQQKYIAEKVFDLLKESWNKFNAEEFKKQ